MRNEHTIDTRLADDPAGWGGYPATSPDAPSLSRALAGFAPITLAEMAGIALMDRTEIKFVLDESSLLAVLPELAAHYRLLNFDGIALNRYRTLYFDTPDFSMYRRHQAGGRNRFKVRSRRYVDSDLSFLEVKHKLRQNRTVKARLQTDGFLTHLTHIPATTSDFLDSALPEALQAVEPKLWNDYVRITLAGINDKERVTLDTAVMFRRDGSAVALPGLVIAEVKQERLNLNSPFVRQMRAHGHRPTGFSKYCVGVASLYDDVKHNAFKPKLRLIRKLTQESSHVQ